MLDLLIIGSGPAGLSAAVYARRSNLNMMVAEKDSFGVGQVSGSVKVDNYLGFSGISGFDLGMIFREHAAALGVPFFEGTAVSVRRTDGGWRTGFDDGRFIDSRALIYAAGARPRRLKVKGEQEFIGKGISFCSVCDGPFFKDKTVAVIGGGDSALDASAHLADLCRKVYLIHWRSDFRGNDATYERICNLDRVEVLKNASIRSIQGDDVLSSVSLSNGRVLKVDGLFEAIGSEPRTEILNGLVMLDHEGYIVAGEDCETTAAGFFAAGDVRTKPLRQVSTAVADGANAVYSAMRYLKRH
ncbi:MAG: FAD-dependent oxidoreductase [Eubacterium sp.]|nr:FAD-dependent oxidoreductase [Eubacterium sp.]